MRDVNDQLLVMLDLSARSLPTADEVGYTKLLAPQLCLITCYYDTELTISSSSLIDLFTVYFGESHETKF